MTDAIDRIVGDCQRHWELAGVPSKAIVEMRIELETHLRAAESDGRAPTVVVGDDLEMFARSWAKEAGGTSAEKGSGAARTFVPLVALIAFVVSLVALSADTGGGDVRNDVWRWVWTVLAFSLSVAEIVTAGFFMLPFGIGAGVAAVLAWVDAALWIQWVAFFGVSLGTLWYLQGFIRRQDQTSTLPVGATRYVGSTGMVLETVDAAKATGRVRVETEEWRAVTDGPSIRKGATVRVTAVRGTRLVVTEG